MFEMFKNLAEEIKSAYLNDKEKPSEALKRKESLYKEAESGRVFSSNR
jgi:ribosomal protein S7